MKASSVKPPAPPLLCYFGHHKCASTWISDIARDVCRTAGLTFSLVEIPPDFDHDLAGYVETQRTEFLAYLDAEVSHANDLTNLLGLHVIRDPRDIIVSAYFSHLYSHAIDHWPELVEHRKLLQRVPKGEGLFLEMEFSHPVLAQIEAWDYEQACIIEERMEALIREPVQHFVRIFSLLGLVAAHGPSPSTSRTSCRMGDMVESSGEAPLSTPRPPRLLEAEEVSKIVREHSFTRKSGGRQVGDEDVKHHYRKGVPGDWRNHFGPEHLEYFGERYGELLQRTGYL